MADVENQIMEDAGFPTEKQPQEDTLPAFKVMGDAKIPISKQAGKLWQQRKDQALKVRTRAANAWDEALRYFNHDHSDPQLKRLDSANGRGEETENIVFSNTTTMLPAIYAKNPNVTIDLSYEGEPDSNPEDKARMDFITTLTRLVNKLLGSQYINLKPKARKQALFALLTNYGWLRLDWVDREFSGDDIFSKLQDLASQYGEAKTTEEITRIEGELMAIEQAYDVLGDSGPIVRVKNPKDIIVDPACDDVSDLTTAKWIMEYDFLPTSYIKAKFMTKDEDSDQYRLIYEPSHYADANEDSSESDTLGVRFIDYNAKDKADQERFEDREYTKVVWVWDRVTRRVYLFNDKCWTYPIWVWEDTLKLSRFFPYFGLAFAPSTTGAYGKGEVTYYLDQQDGINAINRQAKKVRDWAFNKFFYDKNKITQAEVEKVLNSDDKKAYGLDIPEGMKVADFWAPVLPPSAQYPILFNKDDKYKAIDRVSAVSDALRGTQFKVNTNEDAIQSYNDATRIRVGEKVDAIEDMLGDLCRAIAELCVSKMDQTRVRELLSEQEAVNWKQLPISDFNREYNVSIASGSTEKPTSAQKQERAVKVGQVVGQFAKAAPGPTMKVVLKMLERAFDEIVIKKEDFAEIDQAMQAEQQKGTAAQGGGAAPGAPGAEQGGEDINPTIVGAIVSLLPPPVQLALKKLTEQGMPIDQALVAIASKIHGEQ